MIRDGRATAARAATDPAGTGLEQAGDGKMWMDARFRSALEGAGLGGFEAVMAWTDGRCLRVLEDRENWRLELRAQGQPVRGFYLKKHHVRTWQSRVQAKLGGAPGESAGRVEASNARRLADTGIGVMDVVAYGETLRGDGRLESFVLTEELEGYAPLDDFLRRRFVPLPPGRRAARADDLKQLIRQVALLAREFHGAGYNHRDFYCCHLFVRECGRGRFEVKLIDLQRVQRRRWWRRRWLVKDLAQLAFSAPRDRIKCTHRLAFVRDYLGVQRLRPCDKRLIRQVLAKQRRMERRARNIA